MISENDLREIYRLKIVPFWQQEGRLGSFLSSLGNAATIQYMAFTQSVPSTAIVISTGRTESFIKYKELIWDLWQLGYSVFIHDHRGQGLSSRLLADEK